MRMSGMDFRGLDASGGERLVPALQCLGIALLITALARPGHSGGLIREETRGIDVILAVDVSHSMLTSDFGAPDRPLRRIDAAREALADFVRKRPEDRIGLLVFGARAWMLSPLTLDHEMILEEIAGLWIGMVEGNRTGISEALARAIKRFEEGEGPVRARSRIVVLITDGEDNVAGPQTAEALARHAWERSGIRIYTLGILASSSPGENPAPEANREFLSRIADQGGGRFYAARGANGLMDACADVDRLERTPLPRTVRRDFTDLYQPFLLAGMAAWLVGFAGSFWFLRILP